ncbi:competence type IV pilus minor pilin ComGG [Neobacillus endophyticus]|uniref:competence type IV pilus minor pilin ComGG n=1 Tax=Neobacillus endophyticus TaxID=2738405 RepID=UPI001C27C6B2|nr:competence type IV pilus minor pilin ComGG [Neobacillus endophyticus]
MTERKQVHETSIILQQEYYLLSSVKKLEMIYQTSGRLPGIGSINFQKGKMDFQTDPPVGFLEKVAFTLHLDTGETVVGKGYFDSRTKRIVKWSD